MIGTDPALLRTAPMGMFFRYTEKSRRTIVRAKHAADRFGSLEIEPEHLLLALLNDPVLISGVMEGVSEKEILDTINAHLPQREPNMLPHDLPLSRGTRQTLVLAEAETDKLDHLYIRNEHLLLGLVESGDTFAAELLTKKGLSAEKLRMQIKALPQSTDVEEPARRSNRPPEEIDLVRRVNEFVIRREGQSALQLLDDYMGEAGQDRKLRICSLGHFAANTAMQLGDFSTARRYCEETLAYTPEDPMALYVLADCLNQQGETDEARRRVADCRRVALSLGDEHGKIILRMVEIRFPDFKVEP
jgi:tetratricopeptide (TPR) repeat protein